LNAKRPTNQFAKLFHPFDVRDFLENYYEKKTLLVERNEKDYFTNILNRDDIDRLFLCTAIAKSAIRATKDGNEVHSDRFSAGSSLSTFASNDRLLKLFASGHTIIINSGDRVFPNLDRYCDELENELRFRVQPNIYVTPFDAQGFATHYDSHDVFILQVMGSKNWRIFNTPVELPSKRQAHKKGTYTLEDPEMEFTLSEGDSIYIPRGVLHDANTNGVSSAHITLGLHPTYRFDLIQELTYFAQDMPEFRKAIPLGLLSDAEKRSAGKDFREILQRLIDTVDVEDLIQRRYQHFVTDRNLDARNRFKDLAELNKLNLDTVARKRPSSLYFITRDEQSITIEFSGNKVPILPFLEPALDFLLGDDPFAVRDIKGFLSDKGRLELVEKFIQTGFLEIVEINASESG